MESPEIEMNCLGLLFVIPNGQKTLTSLILKLLV